MNEEIAGTKMPRATGKRSMVKLGSSPKMERWVSANIRDKYREYMDRAKKGVEKKNLNRTSITSISHSHTLFHIELS